MIALRCFFSFLSFYIFKSILLVLSSFQGLPVFAIGAGLSTFDKASVSLIIGKKGKRNVVSLDHHLSLFLKAMYSDILLTFLFVFMIAGPLLRAVSHSN